MNEVIKLCPVRYSLELIGGKWKLPIICLLAGNAPVRYGALKRRLGNITNMMLSQSLKELETHGLVDRKQYNEVPPKVEYTITAEARKLIDTLQLLAGWGIGQMAKNKAGEIYCNECQSDC
jgi:DNA-binding HxlR family transcriptional regulator